MRLISLGLLAMLGCASPDGDDGPMDPSEQPTSPDADEPIDMVSFPQSDPMGPGAAPQLPACASPLAKAMFDGARDVAWRGTVPVEYFATARNVADSTVLIDGPKIFPAFRALIAGARHHVSLQTYVWEPNTDPTNEILAGLRELQARRIAERSTEPPVVVRFLLDASILGFGSKVDALPQLWASLEAARLDPAHVTFEVGAFVHIAFGNLHVKTLVVDGRDAIVTGANPQAHHDYDAPWRDSGYRFMGDIAVALLADFDSAWRKSDLWMCGADTTKTIDECRAKPAPISWPVRRPRMADGTCRTMLLATRQSDQDPRSNRIDNTQDQAFLAAWGAAQHHIRVKTPNLNDDAAKAALLAAVKRGVLVDVTLSRGFNDISESTPGQGGDNDTNVAMLYDALAAAGVANACDRLRVRWYSVGGVQPVFGNGIYASHAKYASIDDEVAIIGTANMDTQSWNNSREVNVVVDDPALTQAWDAQLYDADFGRGIRTIQCP